MNLFQPDPEGNRKQSRTDALFFRPTVMTRCKGKCEICGYYCPYIIELHHVVPVSNGGPGEPGNLIALCPNCHSTVEMIRRKTHGENPRVDDWLYETFDGFGPGGGKRMGLVFGIAYGTASYVDGAWVGEPGWSEQSDVTAPISSQLGATA